jgi:hypothetical protein
VILRPILLSVLAAPTSDRALPLSPDPESAAEAALAAVREELLGESIPLAPWVVVAGSGSPGQDSETVVAVRGALAGLGVPSREGRPDDLPSEGAVLEVSHLLAGDQEAIVLRSLRPPTPAVLAPFERKSWVRRLPDADGKGGNLLVRGGSGLEIEEGEARSEAIRVATVDLHRAFAGLGAPARALEGILSPGEVARRFVVDTFVSRETRGFGDAFTGFALVEVPSEEVSRILDRAAAQQVSQRRELRARILALGGTCALLFLGYVAADFATRGAFTKGLRVAAVLAAALAGGLLL